MFLDWFWLIETISENYMSESDLERKENDCEFLFEILVSWYRHIDLKKADKNMENLLYLLCMCYGISTQSKSANHGKVPTPCITVFISTVSARNWIGN